MKVKVFDRDAVLIEIPPHSRTVRIHSLGTKYIQVPYTQFIFLEGEDEVLVFNTKYKISQGVQLYYSIFRSNSYDGITICWGDIKIKKPYDYNKIISDFWLSTFDEIRDALSLESTVKIEW